MRIVLFIVLFLGPPALLAQNNPRFQRAIKSAKDSVESLMTRRSIPGLAVAVAVGDNIVWSEGLGLADIEQRVPVDPARTKFRIGSISKALTATGLALLYQNGKIILDSSIYFYLPEYPRYRYRPTVRQVAGHIAGIRHYRGDEFYISKHYATVSDGLSIFKHDSLESIPGSRYRYSSHGFNLLSAVIEKAANEDFLSFMTKNVFGPLNLGSTVPDMNDSIVPCRSRYYEYQNGKTINAPYVDNSYKWAGGGFISTAHDVCSFGQSLLRADMLKAETVKLFTTPQKLDDGSLSHYGMGFSTGTDEYKRTFFGHSGGSVGGTSDMVIYPNEKIVVVLLTNLSGANLEGMSRDIAHLFTLEGAGKK